MIDTCNLAEHTQRLRRRYIFKLANKDLSLVHCMIPLGSCTMKVLALLPPNVCAYDSALPSS